MAEGTSAVRRRIASLAEEIVSAGTPPDVVGRLLVQHAVELWKRERDLADIASELQNTAENLDPDTDYTFMRP